MTTRFGADGICRDCYRRSWEGLGLCHRCVTAAKAARFSRRERHKFDQPTDLICEICLIRVDKPRKLKLDHCHDKDFARGWLCNRCNCGIGFFRDNPHILISAADYLIRKSDPENGLRPARPGRV